MAAEKKTARIEEKRELLEARVARVECGLGAPRQPRDRSLTTKAQCPLPLELDA